MKKLLLLLAMLLATSLVSMVQAADTKKSTVLRHVVSFKFKETATPDQIHRVVQDFRALKKQIREIQSFECGLNNSPEKLNKGLTHCFILSFKSEKARNIYLEHPAHKAFGASLGPVLADVMVIDFWAQK